MSDETPEIRDPLARLVTLFYEEREGDASLEIEAFARRYPEHGEVLRDALVGMQLMERAAEAFDAEDAIDELDTFALLGGARRRLTSDRGGAEAIARDFVSRVLAELAEHRAEPGRYSREGEIARGGQGAVLAVWDERLRRHLAMKVALASRGDEGSSGVRSLGRFLEEAQITAQLDHPGIVPVHDLGMDPAESVYFTMKLVKGSDLRTVFQMARTRGDGWTRTRVLNVLLKVCEAMAYAHSKGVIHRDLKPSNVMVGKYGEVYVMDWGLARVLGRDDPKDLRIQAEPTEVLRTHREDSGDLESPLVTMDGDVVGTPAYMSPEQALGDAEAMGPHSDVYAVGAMLYQLLTGEMPYVSAGSRLSARAVWALVQKGPPDSVHGAHGVPAELEAICEKAMARETERRYPDMSALAEDLRAYLERRVVLAYETGAVAELRKWVARNKPLAGAMAAAFMALLVGFAIAMVLKAQSDRRRDEVLRLSALQDVEDLLAEADALWPPHPDLTRRFEDWLHDARLLVNELPVHRSKLAELSREPPEQTRWWRNQLQELIAELGVIEVALLAPDAVTAGHGWSISKRLAFARELQSGFADDGDYRRAWSTALPAIEEAYPGLELVPQMGLVPIGPDPGSGLWEFAHLGSGTVAERGDDGRLVLTDEIGVVLVLLPGGTFAMGAQSTDPAGPNYYADISAHEGPVHEVTLSPFFLSKYELTQGQWLGFTGANPSYHRPEVGYQLTPAGTINLLHPVEQVDWNAGDQWLARMGLALPSEAQWEYGARGGTTTAWWTGDERESLRIRGAVNLADQSAVRAGYHWPATSDWPELDDGYPAHAPVDRSSPNPFGLHDVHGNVYEWCRDEYDAGYYARSPRQDPVNAPGDMEGRSVHFVNRGGCFGYTADHARSAARDSNTAEFALASMGLRPARAIVP